jgi:hypothetical protein
MPKQFLELLEVPLWFWISLAGNVAYSKNTALRLWYSSWILHINRNIIVDHYAGRWSLRIRALTSGSVKNGLSWSKYHLAEYKMVAIHVSADLW